MKWRHQGAWKGENRRSVETTKEKRKKEKERWGEAGIRRIAFCLCSIKGEITHLPRFFLKTTALIDQTTWMYQPIFNMKYRQQKSITPVFSSRRYLQLSVAPSHKGWCIYITVGSALSVTLSLFRRGHGSPTISLWHVHYVIRWYICLTNGKVDHIQ